jgi:hypothetical protein
VVSLLSVPLAERNPIDLANGGIDADAAGVRVAYRAGLCGILFGQATGELVTWSDACFPFSL